MLDLLCLRWVIAWFKLLPDQPFFHHFHHLCYVLDQQKSDQKPLIPQNMSVKFVVSTVHVVMYHIS